MTLQVACEQFIDDIDDIVCDCGDTSDETIQAYIDSASDVIAILTGGKVQGRCTDVVRPCGGSCSCGSASLGSCGCAPLSAITLAGPNPQITSILLDGVAFTDYAIVDGQRLIRTDGKAWPGTQNITLASSQPNTFEVTYIHGQATPQLAKDACAEIVCSFINAKPQDARKQTHPNTRSVSISGVSISLEQQAMEIKSRAMMMPYVIRLLTVYAPGGPTPSFVYSPELEDGWQLHTVNINTP
jgi:hypothetical protein